MLESMELLVPEPAREAGPTVARARAKHSRLVVLPLGSFKMEWDFSESSPQGVRLVDMGEEPLGTLMSLPVVLISLQRHVLL